MKRRNNHVKSLIILVWYMYLAFKVRVFYFLFSSFYSSLQYLVLCRFSYAMTSPLPQMGMTLNMSRFLASKIHAPS